MDMRNDLAKARDEWMDSTAGVSCLMGSAEGKYLRNRLERAFIAGWRAKEDADRRTPEQAE